MWTLSPWQKFGIFVLALAVTAVSEVPHDGETGEDRDGKFLSFFQIVTFPNDPCVGGDSKNGTCYTSDECKAKGGTSDGTCASGYGVCCLFSIGCGQSSSENCTYVESSSPTAGECRHTICPCSSNICQLRLDFERFIIAGPSTISVSEMKLVNGQPSDTGTSLANTASNCLTDTFSVTNTGGTTPSPICGINSGQHMYVDVDRTSNGKEGCNTLDFQLGQTGVYTTIPNRQWKIKVTQLSCNSPVLAPQGCDQYYFDSTGTVQTYNFDGLQHLASQQQTMCVRRTRGNCRICWSAPTPDDFAISGIHMTAIAGKGSGWLLAQSCCAYGVAGVNAKKGYDCVQIPGAMAAIGYTKLLKNSRICGRSVGLVTISGMDAAIAGIDATVCSTTTPFRIQFISDGFEEASMEALKPNRGFKLDYEQDATNCPP